MVNIWQTLKIEPTNDESVIRRAYSLQLKQCRPERDPTGYQQLREAFDKARYLAQHGRGAVSLSEADAVEVPETAEEVKAADVVSPEPSSCYVFDPLDAVQNNNFTVDVKREVQRITRMLVDDTFAALTELTTLWQQIVYESRIVVQQQFHLELARALSSTPALTEEALLAVSGILRWKLEEEYASFFIPPFYQNKLCSHLAHLRQLQHDKKEIRYGVPGADMAFRALEGKGSRIPFWFRLIPGLVPLMATYAKHVSDVYPELLVRFNSEVLQWVASPRVALTRGGTFLFVFWAVLISTATWLADGNARAGLGFFTIACLCIYVRHWIITGLSNFPFWRQSYYATECVISLYFIVNFLTVIFWATIAWIPDDNPGGSTPFPFVLGTFLLVMLYGWYELVKTSPVIQRPGMMVEKLFTGPDELIWGPGLVCIKRFLLVIYFISGLTIMAMLLSFMKSVVGDV